MPFPIGSPLELSL